MSTRFFFFLVLIFSVQFLQAQKADLVVKSSDKGLYLEHKVAPKESFYALGRLYNVSPKSLASYNKLDMNKGLQIDQKIRIPLSDSNFTQQGGSGTPVYYKPTDKEGLTTVSNKHNGVDIANLTWWNGLTTNEVKKDTKIIIGFLQSKEMKSITIKGSPDPGVIVAPVALTEKEKEGEEKEAEAELKAEKKEEKKDPPTVVKEEKKPLLPGNGYFKKDFEQQVKIIPVSKDETVTSGIFKTTSGWTDAKYYLLIDKVAPGTIVKVINPSNNKSIYAKVLGEMAGIRQNEGYNIRISNAGAAALEVTEEDKFIVKVNF
ncbi:MAG: LysM peptidoglycan-binding domain-containing protein [Chitinophagaceae bacterium]|nr:LysM peptidoglycan-binding domain-containing protein [Chitinophagaceae bacterium]